MVEKGYLYLKSLEDNLTSILGLQELSNPLGILLSYDTMCPPMARP